MNSWRCILFAILCVAAHARAAGGPAIVAVDAHLFQDSFAQSGLTDVNSPPARDLLDVRIDMAADVGSGAAIVPGDSLVVVVTPTLDPISDPSTQIRLHFSLNLNPLFELPLRPDLLAAGVLSFGTGLQGWDQLEGVVFASQVTTALGDPVPDHYYFDLPDVNFMYPGDVLEYFIEAVDDGGFVSTLPADLYGYDDSEAYYDPRFRMRALPTYTNVFGAQPVVLWINDNGHRGGEAEFLHAMRQAGFYEGDQYDSYTVKAAELPISNGIGSAGAHGATPEQLQGYTRILYFTGDLPNTLSDGSASGDSDKSNDIYALQSWHDQPFDRCVAYFGDDLVQSLAFGSPVQQGYLADVMNVLFVDGDVRVEIGDQSAPHVLPTGLVTDFVADFVVYGGLPTLNDFDSILPGPGALRAHGFEIAGMPGLLHPPAASVYFDREAGDGSLKIDMTFPYAFEWIRALPEKAPVPGSGPGSELIQEYINHRGPPPPPPDTSPATHTPAALQAPTLRAAPNPFNPRTSIWMTLAADAPCRLAIFDLRGQLVRMLHLGSLTAGEHQFRWDGMDAQGHPVASGVYLLEARSPAGERTAKLALIR